jgi:hypothetical protein
MTLFRVDIAHLKYIIQKMTNYNLKLKLLTILKIMICFKKPIRLHLISEPF